MRRITKSNAGMVETNPRRFSSAHPRGFGSLGVFLEVCRLFGMQTELEMTMPLRGVYLQKGA